MFQALRSFFSKLTTPYNVADQRFGLGAARRVAIAVDDEVSRLCSYRGHMAILLFDVMPPDCRAGALLIDSCATGTLDDSLPKPEQVHDELVCATFGRIARELGYTGRIGISFTEHIQENGYRYCLRGATARSVESGRLSVFTSAA